MATITDIVLAGEGFAGSNRSWRVIDRVHPAAPYGAKQLWHYSHMMLQWNPDNPTDESVLDYSTGWGSVSDQGAMNKVFRALGLPYYFSRQGGASIGRVMERV